MKSSKIIHFKKHIIHQFDEVESTNSLAFSLAQNRKIFDGEIILSSRQSKGRGRLQRSWESPIGNLYFSLVLQPKIEVEKISQISFVAICALQITISKIFEEQKIIAPIQNKWPNDLLINQKKVAGILLESKISDKNCEFVILGMGVNIVSSPQQTIFPATNLQDFLCSISAQKLLEIFLENFEKIYESWLNFGFKNIQELWIKNAYKINENMQINLGNNICEGVFLGIDLEGNALVQEGCEVFTAGQATDFKKITKISCGEVS